MLGLAIQKKLVLDFCTKEQEEKYKDDVFLKKNREAKIELAKYEAELDAEYRAKSN